MVTKATLDERTVIHAVGDTLLAGNGSSGAPWKFSLAMTGDFNCHVFASPMTPGDPLRSRLVTIKFPSMSDMEANLEALLSTKRLPKAVVAAIVATAPAFFVDAEIAYQTDQYLFRPD